MNIRHLLIAALVATPVAVSAQTANTPGGQAATGSGLEQSNTNNAQRATPGRTATSPDMTNPSGSLPARDSTTNATTTTPKTTTRHRATNKTAPGDVPTYPAPAPDGTPTK
jgi:hypothetical protein